MVVFERVNYVCVMQEQGRGKWEVKESGTIRNHQMLLEYVTKLDIDIPPHYYSLPKYLQQFSL